MRHISATTLLIVTASVAAQTSAPATSPAAAYGQHALAATLDTADVQESSGVIASTRTSDLFWTHNDSGSSGPRLWAVRLNATDLGQKTAHVVGYLELTGASNEDWEDISAGPNHTIYVLDGGDNPPCTRDDKRIHRIVEPPIDATGPRLSRRVTCESIRFEYPAPQRADAPAAKADRFDAECLMVHPTTGDIYIITKRTSNDVGVAKLFRLPAPDIQWNSRSIHLLEYVTDLTDVLHVSPNVLTTVTGGDISPDGRRVIVRRYSIAYEFPLAPGRPLADALRQPPLTIPLAGEVQGEGICYSPTGDIVTTSEVKRLHDVALGPPRCPIYIIPNSSTRRR